MSDYKPYWQKLKDPRWQKKRLEVLERAKWRCEDCGDESVTLHVHHKIYQRETEPWDYPDGDYVCCCESCHERREVLAHRSRLIFQCMTLEVAENLCDALFSFGGLVDEAAKHATVGIETAHAEGERRFREGAGS